MEVKRVLTKPIVATGVVTCVLEGKFNPGDQIFFYWLDDRGGRSATAVLVKEGQSLEDLALEMKNRSEFTNAFTVANQKNTVLCICGSKVPPGKFCTEVIGTGTGTLRLDT